MIRGLGVDIAQIDRIKNAIENPRFLAKIYTPSEQDYIARRGAGSAAGFFSAKEAAMKALGRGMDAMGFAEIEVTHDEFGRPLLMLHGRARERFEALGGGRLHLSISHERDYATATVIWEDAT